MKKTSLLLTIVATGSLFLASCGSQNQANEAESPEAPVAEEAAEVSEASIDITGSAINWSGEMLGMYGHNGTVGITEAKVSMSGDKVAGGSFVADLTNMIPLDENYDPSKGHGKEELVGHLSSPDFFDVANHPTASFEITEVAEDGSSAKGNLTVRGITNEETVENISLADGTLSGTSTFDRTK